MSQSRSSYLLLGILSLIWGSSFILMSEGLQSLPPISMAAYRIALAGLILLPFVRWRRVKLSGLEWRTLFLAGLLGNFLPAFFFALAQTRITSSLSGALNALTPLFVLVVGMTVFKVPFNRYKSIGILIGLAGVLLLLLTNGLEIRGGGYGLLILVATLCYGINVNIIKYRLGHLPPLLVAAAPLGMMSVLALLVLMIRPELPVLNGETLRSYAAVSVLSIVGTALSLIWFNRLIQQTNAVFASSVTYLIPIVALAWGLLFGEAIDMQQVVGMGIVFAAIYVVNKA